MSKENSTDNIYKLDGRVPIVEAVPLGIQHIFAMFLGNISPLLIVCGLINMDDATKTILIQNAMFVAGLITLLQLYPIWKLGARLPIVMGTSSGFISTAKAIAVANGYSAILGASIVGAIFEMILGFFVKPLKKILPPIVTSLVIISIGLSLLPVGINYFGGNSAGPGSEGFGDPKNLFVGTVVILVIILLKQFTKSFLSVASILIAIVVGYIVSICLGMVDFTAVSEAAWISIPKPIVMIDGIGIEFVPSAVVAMVIMYISTTVETVGNISGITNGGLDREPTDNEISGGVIADGFGSFFAALFGVLPNTSFGQNVGLITTTKVVNRFVIATGAVFLLLVSFFPKLSALFTAMPQSVLGGAAVIMFAMIFVSGLQSLTREKITERNGLIIALSLGLGIGISNVPAVLDQLPSWVGQIFAQNGIIMTFVIATVLNLILPNKDER